MTSASLLPNGKQQFLDQNGKPLASGQVFFYIPNTTTFKATWQDPDGIIENTNPVELDAAGEAVIYGAGQYRQVVKDVFGNTIWDELTQSNNLTGQVYPIEVADLPDLLPLPTTVSNVAYVYSKRGQDDFTLQNWTDWSGLAASDPLGGVIRQSTVDATKCWVRAGFYGGGLVRAEWFGWQGANNSLVDDKPALQAAINFAGAVYNGSQGTFVTMPAGISYLGSQIELPNRVGIKGPNGRGLIFKLMASYNNLVVFYASNGTTSMFGSRMEDMFIDATGHNLNYIVQAEAWQETCGMYRVATQWDGTTQGCVLLENGYGGASFTTIEDCEFFSNSSNANGFGIRVNEISTVGGFMLNVNRTSITGSATNQLPAAIDMVNDSLRATSLHCEYVNEMILMEGMGGVSADTISGSFNNVVNVVALGSGFTGKVDLKNILPNGATGSILLDVTGKIGSIGASENLAHFSGPNHDCQVNCGSLKSGVTGNGVNYIVLFDTVVFDPLSGYNVSTGEYTTGVDERWYSAEGTVGWSAVNTNTAIVVQLEVGSTVYEVFRGQPYNLTDSTGNARVSFSLGRFNTAAADKIKLIVVGAGGAAGSMSILAGTSMTIKELLD